MNTDLNGWQDEQTTDLKAFSALCNRILEAEKEIADLESQAEKIKRDIEEDRDKLLLMMTESNLARLDGEHGHVVVDEIISVRQPETTEDKLKFFDYLKAQDLFYNMVNVNSRTLSSWAKKEIKAMEEKGSVGWVPPGLQSPYREFKLKTKLKKA